MAIDTRRKPRTRNILSFRSLGVTTAILMGLALAACGSSGSATSESVVDASSQPGDALPETTRSAPDATAATDAAVHTFKAEVWVDNWFALYVGEEKIGEDSVPITTERSFNAETLTFQATYPLELRAVSRDYIENDTGLEYIGTGRQQIGDGGFILQITDLTTGKVVAATDESWKGYVTHAAPLNDCERSSTPAQTCTNRIIPEPSGWKTNAFDDSSWVNATVFTEDQVGTKDGYDSISWDPTAKLIWTSDLKIDNTILWRKTVAP